MCNRLMRAPIVELATGAGFECLPVIAALIAMAMEADLVGLAEGARGQ